MISQFLQDLPRDALISLGAALGLIYPKLQRMTHLPEELVAAWIRREDNVRRPITLRTLAEGLKRIGQTGVASKILNQN